MTQQPRALAAPIDRAAFKRSRGDDGTQIRTTGTLSMDAMHGGRIQTGMAQQQQTTLPTSHTQFPLRAGPRVSREQLMAPGMRHRCGTGLQLSSPGMSRVAGFGLPATPQPKPIATSHEIEAVMRAATQRPLPWAKRDGVNWEAPPRRSEPPPKGKGKPLTSGQALRLAAGRGKGWKDRPSLRQVCHKLLFLSNGNGKRFRRNK